MVKKNGGEERGDKRYRCGLGLFPEAKDDLPEPLMTSVRDIFHGGATWGLIAKYGPCSYLKTLIEPAGISRNNTKIPELGEGKKLHSGILFSGGWLPFKFLSVEGGSTSLLICDHQIFLGLSSSDANVPV